MKTQIDDKDELTSFTGDEMTVVVTGAPGARVHKKAKIKNVQSALNGVFYPSGIAGLRAIPTRSWNLYATVIKRQAGEPKNFYWDATRSDVDDPIGFTVVRPDDFVASGSMGVWIQDN
jgi:hypothetical protein